MISLTEENNLLRYKVELLLDMVSSGGMAVCLFGQNYGSLDK